MLSFSIDRTLLTKTLLLLMQTIMFGQDFDSNYIQCIGPIEDLIPKENKKPFPICHFQF